MISEKVEQYCICEDCYKRNKCEYRSSVDDTLKKYKDTPLNIHFINCDEYKSMLMKLIELSERNDKIAEKIKADDKEEFEKEIRKSVENFSNNLFKME